MIYFFIVFLFLAYFVLLPLLEVIIGLNSVSDCPFNSSIPYWLIINGVFTILLALSIFLFKYFDCSLMASVICLFLFSWLIRGESSEKSTPLRTKNILLFFFVHLKLSYFQEVSGCTKQARLWPSVRTTCSPIVIRSATSSLSGQSRSHGPLSASLFCSLFLLSFCKVAKSEPF